MRGYKMKVYAISCKTPKFPREINNLLEGCEKGSLVCLPEYFLDGLERYSGITWGHKLFTRLQTVAAEKEIYVAAGMVKDEGYARFITGVLISSDGEILGEQSKFRPTSFEMKKGIYLGNFGSGPIDTDFGTVSFSMCKDQWYLDHKVDAEILIHPRGFGLNHDKFGEFYESWKRLDQTTAMLKKAYVIGTTGAYDKCPLADIIDFEGNVMAETTLEGSISAEIDLKALREYRKGEKQSWTVPRF